MPTPDQIAKQVQFEREAIAQGLKRLHENTKKLEQSTYASASVYGCTSIDTLLPLVKERIEETTEYKLKRGQGSDFKIIKELLGKNYKYELKDDRSLVAIQGPSAVQILNDIIPEVNKLNFMSGGWFNYLENKIFVTRSGYTGEDGFEISFPNSLAEKFTKNLMSKGAELIGLGARDTLRLEAGLCLYGHELNTKLTPIEANLNWAISKSRLDDMNFIGSAMIKEQLSQGTKQLRVGIQPEGRIIAREKTKIFNDKDQIIGEITSGTFGPSVNGPIAMGYIDSEYSNKNSKIFLEIRGKKHPANICGLPFYKKSYVKGAA